MSLSDTVSAESHVHCHKDSLKFHAAGPNPDLDVRDLLNEAAMSDGTE